MLRNAGVLYIDLWAQHLTPWRGFFGNIATRGLLPKLVVQACGLAEDCTSDPRTRDCGGGRASPGPRKAEND